ncbi:hypothetical protein P245_20970 [Comamonas thiooxydans]|uniref:Uncharacterized protein n=1 Tax=Comamonas thiooxydans TaxID=363952 RepID=A0A0E3BAY0_9BURK|nr:hypothetical protein [Comamonas thiooxydans]KGG86193.1 hypothetical protein P245_20970 [Comamonas thiooxydans]
MAANVSNPKAAALAKAINRGGNAQELVRNAIVDAQLHDDWRGVVAIENSLEHVEDRTVARHVGYVGTRALIVNRLDLNAYAHRLPTGYKSGLAWLVCFVFLRTDGDVETGLQIAEKFQERAIEAGSFGINWGKDAVMCLPPVAFAGPTRLSTTLAMGRGDYRTIFDIQDFAINAMQAEVGVSRSHNDSHPVSFVVWGTVVTGSDNPAQDLFDESVWCPGIDFADVTPQITRLLAEAASEFDGNTYIHPECLSAIEATEFAQRLTKEQVVDSAINGAMKSIYGDDLSAAHVRITKIMPKELPYMDQLMIGFAGRANTIATTYRFPRSDKPLEEDAEFIASLCRDRGIADIRTIDLNRPIHANDYPGYSVGLDGEWIEGQDARLGDARSLVTRVHWELPEEPPETYTAATHQLPAVIFLDKVGVPSVLEQHYTPKIWSAVKAALSTPCDPLQAVEHVLRVAWQGTTTDLEWLLEKYEPTLFPHRHDLLCMQFKQCKGTIVRATESLLHTLRETDIGDDCPSTFLRSGFDCHYLLLRVPADAIDEPEDPEHRRYIDGLLVQRWNVGGLEHLLLDVFITSGSDVHAPDIVEDAIPLKLVFDETTTLAQLRQQIDPHDGLSRQALDLFAGVTLYMNSRDARIERRDDHQKAADALKLMNRKKRKPADYHKVQGSFDAIYVGPEFINDTSSAVSGQGHARSGVKPHYRRGFVRYGQRVGKGLTETRPVFISPVLVNAHKLLEGDPAKKQYVVGARK